MFLIQFMPQFLLLQFQRDLPVLEAKRKRCDQRISKGKTKSEFLGMVERAVYLLHDIHRSEQADD